MTKAVRRSACNHQVLVAELRRSCEKGSTLPRVRTVTYDCPIKGLGMFSSSYTTGHIKDPVPLVENSRAPCSGGSFLPCFIHQ